MSKQFELTYRNKFFTSVYLVEAETDQLAREIAKDYCEKDLAQSSGQEMSMAAQIDAEYTPEEDYEYLLVSIRRMAGVRVGQTVELIASYANG